MTCLSCCKPISQSLCFGDRLLFQGDPSIPPVAVITATPLFVNSIEEEQVLHHLEPLRQANISAINIAAVKCGDRRDFDSSQTACAEYAEATIKHHGVKVAIAFEFDKYKRHLLSTFFKGITVTELFYKLYTVEFFGVTCTAAYIDVPKMTELPSAIEEARVPIAKATMAARLGFWPPPHPHPVNHVVITSDDQLPWLYQQCSDDTVLSFDTEIGGTDPNNGLSVALRLHHPNKRFIGASVSWAPGYAAFVDFRRVTASAVVQFLQWIQKHPLVMQHGKFDRNQIMVTYGIDLIASLQWDTQLMHHMIHEADKQHGLKVMTDRYLWSYEAYDAKLDAWFKDNKIHKDRRDFNLLPDEVLYQYAATDADVTRQLWQLFLPQLQNRQYLLDISHHINAMYADMELHGWPYSLDEYRKLKDHLDQQIAEYESRLYCHPEMKVLPRFIEGRLQAKRLLFYDETTREVYNDSSCQEPLPDAIADPETGHKRSFVRQKDRSRVVGNTYTRDDLQMKLNDPILRIVLYDKAFFNLAAPIQTKEGESVGKEALLTLRELYQANKRILQIINDIIALKRLEKWRADNVKPVLGLDKEGTKEASHPWVQADGRVHCSFIVSGFEGGGESISGGTKTGRWSSREPNQNNKPSRKGGHITKVPFIGGPPRFLSAPWGHMLVSPTPEMRRILEEPWYFLQIDLSQIELRVLADQSQDDWLLSAYHNNEDLHSKLAAEQFDCDYETLKRKAKDADDPEHEMYYNRRLCGKTSWFAVMYGAGPNKVRVNLMSEDVLMPIADIQRSIDTLYSRLPGVTRLKQMVSYYAPFWQTPTGRQRHADDYYSPVPDLRAGAERQLFNFAIQSYAADLAAVGFSQATRRLRELREKYLIMTYAVGSVYDSLLLCIPESELWLVEPLKHDIENPQLPPNVRFTVPLIADVEIGKNWGTLEGYSKWTQKRVSLLQAGQALSGNT